MGVGVAAPIPPPCNHSRCLERGVAGYCGSSAASSDTYLLLSGDGLVGGVPLLLRCRDLLYHCWPLRLIDTTCITFRLLHVVAIASQSPLPTPRVVIVLLGSPHHVAANMN